jgi:hypothetical protein
MIKDVTIHINAKLISFLRVDREGVLRFRLADDTPEAGRSVGSALAAKLATLGLLLATGSGKALGKSGSV